MIVAKGEKALIGAENLCRDDRAAIRSYCMLCRTGAELSVAQSITRHYPDLTAIAPVKKLQEKRNGQWEQHEQIMLPGYLFLYSERELPFDLCRKVHLLYRSLEYERGMRILTGSDEEYAQWVYRHQGNIGISKVTIEEGQNIQVIDGPLLDCQGTIVKIDRHKRRAMVSFIFDGEKRMVSISVECVLPIEPSEGK